MGHMFFFLFKMTFFKLILSMVKYENPGSLNLTGHILSVHGMYTATGCRYRNSYDCEIVHWTGLVDKNVF